MDKVTLIVVIVTVILIVCIVVLFKRRALPKSQEVPEEPVMIGGLSEDVLPKEILELIDVRWPTVSILTNAVLQKVGLDKFKYSVKTDGIHANILIYKGAIYDVTTYRNDQMVKKVRETDCKRTLILDTELYNDTYYVFDVYYDETILKSNFDERMKHTHVDELDGFQIKEFHPITSIQELIKMAHAERDPKSGVETDGVILQRIDLPYLNKGKWNSYDATVFKLKPRSLMTIDALLRYDSRKEFYQLYTIGSAFDALDSLSPISRNRKLILNVDRSPVVTRMLPSNVLIPFDSPFYPNLDVYVPRSEWKSTGFYKRISDAANALIEEALRSPGSLHDKICEMALTEDNVWVPIRIRHDKSNPNGFKIAQSVVSVIFDPIRDQSDIYFQKDLSANEDIQTYIHSLNSVFRRYTVETYLNHANTVIDLCGGRGGDELSLYSCGTGTIYAIDGDTTALKQYADRSYTIKLSKYTSLTNVTTIRHPLNLSVLHHVLGNQYKAVEADLASRVTWTGKVDGILMNYAIHYVCGMIGEMKALASFVSKVLSPTGVFVFTYFDGDSIIANAKDDVSKVGPFKITLLKKRTAIYAMMPLLTIQGGEYAYREEPLVTSKLFTALEAKLETLKDESLYEATRKWSDAVRDPSNLLEYFKLLRVRVMRLRAK